MNLLQRHGPVLPVLLPAATALLLLWLGDAGGSPHDHPKRRLTRRIALASVLLGLALAVALTAQADTGAITVYRLGDWPAPFGIVLVLDRLAALMLALTAAVALPLLWPGASPKPGWVTVPLDLSQPDAILLLALIISNTPGTVCCVVDEAARQIVVHVLDLDDPAALVAQIKQRYEQPIQEISR